MLYGLRLDAWITIATLVALMAVLVFTRLRSDVVFLGAVGVLFLTGVLDSAQAFGGFSNSSVIIVAAMFVIGAGLSYTGVLQWITKNVLGRPKGEIAAMLRLMLPVGLLSVFVNNTSVVALFVGIVKLWSRKIGIKPSKLLIPLSYAGGMGGPLAAIATPTTLLLFGMYEKQTGESLDILASLLPALLCFATTTLALIIFRRLLPNNDSPETAFERTGDYTLEMLVTSNNPHIGKTIGELGLNRAQAGTLVELIHFDNERSILPVGDSVPLLGGDRLIFSGPIDELMELATKMGFVSPDHPVISAKAPRNDRRIKTAYVCFGSKLIGKCIGETRFEQDNGMTLVAVSRKGERISKAPREVVLQAGDTLLLVHPPHAKVNTNALASQLQFIDSTEIPVNGIKPLISTSILLCMVLLASTGVMTLLQSAFLAAAAMLVFSCCTPTQAMSSINWKIIITLAGGIAVSTAIQKTGVADYVATGIFGLCGNHPLLVLIALCAMAAIITEFMANSSVIVLMFPIVYAATESLGRPLFPYAIALLLAVNSAFLTLVSTPLNLLVYGPGGYSAKDFLRIGLPLKLVYMATAIATICFFYDI
jgi:di/tricarboxylate transporter